MTMAEAPARKPERGKRRAILEAPKERDDTQRAIARCDGFVRWFLGGKTCEKERK